MQGEFMWVTTDSSAPSMPTLAISPFLPDIAKAMRAPNTPRWPVNWAMTSLAQACTRARNSGPR